MRRIPEPRRRQLIKEVLLTADAASFEFPEIPQTYRHLQLVLEARTNRAGVATDSLAIRFNGSSTNYRWQVEETVGATRSAAQDTASTMGLVAYVACAGSPDAGHSGVADLWIPHYRGIRHKMVIANGRLFTDSMRIMQFNTHWQNGAAITSISVFPNVGGLIVAGSVASLYGVS